MPAGMEMLPSSRLRSDSDGDRSQSKRYGGSDGNASELFQSKSFKRRSIFGMQPPTPVKVLRKALCNEKHTPTKKSVLLK